MEISLKASFVFYGAALAATLLGFLFNKDWRFKYSVMALFAGWLFATAHVGIRWYMSGRAPLSNQYESLVS